MSSLSTTLWRSLTLAYTRGISINGRARSSHPCATFYTWDNEREATGANSEGDGTQSSTEQETPKPKRKAKMLRSLTGLTVPMVVDKKLMPLVDDKRVMSRSEVVKRINDYAKVKGLIGKDKKMILLDDQLKAIFGTDTTQVHRLGVLRFLKPLLTSPKEHGPNIQKMAERYTADYLEKRGWPEYLQKKEQKRQAGLLRAAAQRRQKTGIYVEYQLGSELAEICGEGIMARQEAGKRLWQYIKKNQLQDPVNRLYVIPDDRLMRLRGAHNRMKCTELPKLISQNIEGRA